MGDRIRAAREAAGLDPIGLAYKAGVDLRTIQRIEAGEVTPRRSTVAVIDQAIEAHNAAQAPAAA